MKTNNSWEDLLDELSLPSNVRTDASLTVWREFPLGFPKKSELNELIRGVMTLLQTEKLLNVVTFEESQSNLNLNSCICRTICLDNMVVLRELWQRLAGNYILILSDKLVPNEFCYEGEFGYSEEEKIIGYILLKTKKLLLKTPDGNELLHLTINIG